MDRKIFYMVATGAGIVACCTLFLWYWLPIYPDELGYRIYSARAWLDNWHRMSGFPACETSSIIPIPWPFYPAALFYSSVNWIKDMHDHRSLGIAIFLIYTIVLGIFSIRIVPKPDRWRAGVILLLAGAPLFVGVLPSTLVMLRAEPPILLLVAFTFWAFTKRSYWYLITLLFLYSAAFYIHPKTVFFLPIVLLVMVRLTWPKRYITLLSLIWLLAITGIGSSIHHWQLLHCPENPKFEARIRYSSINPADALINPQGFLKEVIATNRERDWRKLIMQMTFQKDVELNVLPSVTPSPIIVFANKLIVLSEAITVLLAGYFFAVHGWLVWRNLRARHRMRSLVFGPEAMPCILFFCYTVLFAQLLLNRTEYFYDIGYWFTLLILFNAVSLMVNWHMTARRVNLWRALLSIHLIVAVISVLVTATTLYKKFHQGFAGPGIPLVGYHARHIQRDISEALAQCHLQVDSPKLAVDDFTYPYLEQSSFPYSITYASATLGDWPYVMQWLKAHHASGIVTRCNAPFGTSAVEHAHRVGEICCMSLQE